MLQYFEIEKIVIDTLEKGLSPSLTYHNVEHTLDVLKQVMVIASLENIEDADDILLLKIGALYHDVGFLTVYEGHEEKSCEIAKKELPYFGFSLVQVEKICELISATKVPQQPQNKLEEIICDADLDYLGRADFFTIGEGLYKEFREGKIVSNELEWNLLQIRFLESHQYFTSSSINRRNQQKQLHLEQIKRKVL